MQDFGRSTGESGRLAAWIRAAGDRLFREDDARARGYGWQVQVRHGGLSRTYRDPRFDGLQSCPACRGSGIDQHERACDRCSGAGRIRLGEPLCQDAGWVR
jgi:hypothetical protein